MEKISRRTKTNSIDISRFKLQEPKEDKDWSSAVNNAMAQLDYQENRFTNLDLLNKYGSNAWKIHNFQMEQLIKNIKDELDNLNETILAINMERKQDQQFTATKLKSMKQKQSDLVSRILQIRLVNDKLEKELNKI